MEIPEIKSEEIKKILDFKKEFESKTIQEAFAVIQEPHELYGVEKIREFLTELDVSGFNLVFDYQAWMEEQTSGFHKDVTFLQKADLDTLRKLMTSHIRIERFVAGHLKELFDNGYMVAFLNRLEELYQQM